MDGGTSSPSNHSAQSRGEEGATELDRHEQLSAQLWSGLLDCRVCWKPLRPQDPVWSFQGCDNVLHRACAQRRALSGQDGEEGATALDRREQLSAQLWSGSLDCVVCWEPLQPQDPVWSCQACYNVLHLACARRWALFGLGGSGGWPCPACRHEEPRVPTEYRCWCGKRRDPDPDRGPSRVPHSCGEECGKPRACDHRCALRCHPGPCPPCDVQVKRWCDCGRKLLLVACGQQAVCGAVCGLPLSCGRHFCERTCHPVPCEKCQLLRTVVCWCGSKTRQVPCDSDEAPANGFACNLVCGRVLTTFIRIIAVLICLYDFFFLPLEKKNYNIK